MELLKHEQLQDKYYNLSQEEVDVVYDIFTLATQAGVADKAAQAAQNTINIQGFRKGKVPRAIIEKRLGTHNLYGNILSDLWSTFCRENNIVTGYRADLDDIHTRIDGAIVFKVVTILFPSLELKMRDKYVVDVTQDVMAKVGQQLQSLSHKHTKVESVEGRETKWGDVVVVDFTGSVGNQEDADLCANDVTLEIGARQVVIPGFEEALTNININETKSFELQAPEDFAERLPNHPRAGYLAGRTINFSVTVKEIKEKHIPHDEELFKLENKNSYEELYRELATTVFDNMKNNLDDICSRASNDIIVDNEEQLMEKVQPPLVEARILNFLDKNKQYFEQLDTEKRSEQLKRIIPSLTKSVYQDVVYNCLLNSADAEQVTPSEEEIKEEAKKIATKSYMQSQGKVKLEAETKRLLEQEYNALYRSVQRRKVYVVLNNKIEVKFDETNEEFLAASQLDVATINNQNEISTEEIAEPAIEQTASKE